MPAPAPGPRTALVMHPVLCGSMLGSESLDRLDAVASVLDRAPIAAFDDPRCDALLGDVEVLLTGWGCPRLDDAVLARMPALRLVAHAAGTVKNHVTAACFDRGLHVTSAAAANAVPVAEYTVAAVLFANKRVIELARRYAELRQGRLWPLEAPGLGNYRKRVGVVGASHVGRLVLERLRAYDLDLYLSDPTLDADTARALGATWLELDDLLAHCDVVSLHAPLLPSTRGLLDARRLALMRDRSTLINTARGALVDGEALERELVSGRLHAVIDTTEPEILPADSPLYALPNVLLTPHIAGSLGDETHRMMALAIDEIERFARGEPLRHAVTREQWDTVA